MNAKVAAGESIYTLDDARIRAIDPDLILAQDLCQVCAVPSGAVERALDVIGCHALVVSLDPGRLDEVIDCVGLVGAATGTGERADVLMESLRGRVEAVRRRVHGREPTPGTGVGVGGPSVQRRALGSRHGGGSGRRAGPRRRRCPVAPAHLGRDRSRTGRHHGLHAVWIRPRGSGRAGRPALGAP